MDIRAQKLWQRGMIHSSQGNLAAAQANFESFLARVPGSAGARFRLSLIHAQQGRYLAAIAMGERVLLDQPDRVELLTHLARCHLMFGQPEVARALATRALARPRDNPVVLDSLGVVMTRLDEQALAMELFDQAIALESRRPSMYFNRALAQKQFDMIEGAERDLETCVAMNPGHAKAHWTLASLRTQDRLNNHVRRLGAQLELARPSSAQEELLSLALFKEFDDISEPEEAWPALKQGILSRRDRWIASGYQPEGLVDTLIDICDKDFVSKAPRRPMPAAPLFIFGMPQSGVALLGSLLSRHSKVQHLGTQQVFARLLSQQLGRDSLRTFDATAFKECRTVDFEALGRRYMTEVLPKAGKQLLICESQAMNFQLAAFIARALPGARMLHLMRDPIDNCISILGHAIGEVSLPSHDPGALAAYYRDYDRLLQHWHQVMPGAIMDVNYESLVERPEMVLRVICAFIGIRYGSSLRMGLQLHQRSIGRGHRYSAKLPALAAGLAQLGRKSRRA